MKYHWLEFDELLKSQDRSLASVKLSISRSELTVTYYLAIL